MQEERDMQQAWLQDADSEPLDQACAIAEQIRPHHGHAPVITMSTALLQSALSSYWTGLTWRALRT